MCCEQIPELYPVELPSRVGKVTWMWCRTVISRVQPTILESKRLICRIIFQPASRWTEKEGPILLSLIRTQMQANISLSHNLLIRQVWRHLHLQGILGEEAFTAIYPNKTVTLQQVSPVVSGPAESGLSDSSLEMWIFRPHHNPDLRIRNSGDGAQRASV